MTILYIEIPYITSEVICVKCGNRWIAARPYNTLLKDLHCKKCGKGFTIETGENIELKTYRDK